MKTFNSCARAPLGQLLEPLEPGSVNCWGEASRGLEQGGRTPCMALPSCPLRGLQSSPGASSSTMTRRWPPTLVILVSPLQGFCLPLANTPAGQAESGPVRSWPCLLPGTPAMGPRRRSLDTRTEGQQPGLGLPLSSTILLVAEGVAEGRAGIPAVCFLHPMRGSGHCPSL